MMCIAYPARVLEVDGEVAIVLARGRHQRVPLIAVEELVQVDDWILVQSGLAIARVSRDEAMTGGWT